MKEKRTQTVKLLGYLTVIGFILGILKVEYFLHFIPVHIVGETRIISYVTLGISTMFFYLMTGVAIMTTYYTLEMIMYGRQFDMGHFFESIKYFIWSLIFNEFSKLIITLLTFKSFGNVMNNSEVKQALMKNELWIQLMTLSDLFFIAGGVLMYVIALKRSEKDIKGYVPYLSAIPLIISFVIFRFFEA